MNTVKSNKLYDIPSLFKTQVVVQYTLHPFNIWSIKSGLAVVSSFYYYYYYINDTNDTVELLL